MTKRTRFSLGMFTPKLVQCLRTYTRADLVNDLIAGLTVGLVALPLAMAFAISSGVKPEAGIYTAIIAGLVVSALGGSRCQIGGPTGAFVVIVAGIVTKFGVDGLAMCTAMAGVILLVMGFTGLGRAVRYIPRPVIVGFTNGIALLIASTQLKDFLGLPLDKVPSEFLERLEVLGGNLGQISMASVTVAACSLAILIFWPRLTRRVPASIVALLLTTIVCLIFEVQVPTIGSKFGGIPTGLPPLWIPTFRSDMILPLIPSALTVAMLAAIESLLSAVVADRMSGDKHNPNAEIVAQGLANLLSPMVGGIPATGAIARTATNIRSGARSPVAGIVHALTLLLILLAAAPLAKFIPLPTLAAVLLIVAYNMGEWFEIPVILRLSAADIAVWATTFGLTVMADLTVAVGVGLVLAAVLYIHRVTETTTVSFVTDHYIREGRPHVLQDKVIPPYVTILRIHGPFLFGATEKLDETTTDLTAMGPVVIVRLRNMTALDSSGLHALESFADRLHKSGRTLLICGARHQPAKLLRKSAFLRHLGAGNALPHVEAALKRAVEVYEGPGGMKEKAGEFSAAV
jgi:SulP family sulfate permease